jgi:hypothetical protein
MGKPANFEILFHSNNPDEPLVINDTGPWNIHLTVTNDIDNVIEKLFQEGLLVPGKRLKYYDSEGTLTEVIIKERKFAGYILNWEKK